MTAAIGKNKNIMITPVHTAIKEFIHRLLLFSITSVVQEVYLGQDAASQRPPKCLLLLS